jgi:hypothetical protein
VRNAVVDLFVESGRSHAPAEAPCSPARSVSAALSCLADHHSLSSDFLPPRIFTHSSRSGPGGHTEPQESRRRHQHAKTELEALIHSIAARDGRGFNAQVHSAALAFLRGLGADMCLGPQSSSGVAKLVEQPSDSTSHYSFSASPLHVCANARAPCGAFRVTCV